MSICPALNQAEWEIWKNVERPKMHVEISGKGWSGDLPPPIYWELLLLLLLLL